MARECWSYRFQPSLVNWVANVVTSLGVLSFAVTAAQLPGTPAHPRGVMRWPGVMRQHR